MPCPIAEITLRQSAHSTQDIPDEPFQAASPSLNLGTLKALEQLNHEELIPTTEVRPSCSASRAPEKDQFPDAEPETPPEHNYHVPMSEPHPLPSETAVLNTDLTSLLTICKANISTFRHVPKTCKDQFADLVTYTYSKVAEDPESVLKLTLVFMLPRCTLYSPKRDGRQQWNERQKEVRQQMSRWREGHYLELWNEALHSQETNR